MSDTVRGILALCEQQQAKTTASTLIFESSTESHVDLSALPRAYVRRDIVRGQETDVPAATFHQL
jgi:hypothetical protein